MTNWGRAQTPKGAATTQLQPVPMLPSGHCCQSWFLM